MTFGSSDFLISQIILHFYRNRCASPLSGCVNAKYVGACGKFVILLKSERNKW